MLKFLDYNFSRQNWRYEGAEIDEAAQEIKDKKNQKRESIYIYVWNILYVYCIDQKRYVHMYMWTYVQNASLPLYV